MAKFIKPTGRKFQDFKAQEKFTTWSQSAKSDYLFLTFFFSWIIPLLLITIYAVLFFSKLPDQIPLFYSHSWGNTQLANRYYVFLPAAGTLLLGFFNFGFAVSLHHQDKIASYLLAGTATLVSLLATITTFNIINLIK